jgi:hypothetical protein
MCSIVGWFGNISTDEKLHILNHGKERGRDGHGFWIDGEEHRGMGDISTDLYNKLLNGKRVVGNFNLIDRYFNKLDDKEIEAEVNHRFLQSHLKKTQKALAPTMSEASGLF